MGRGEGGMFVLFRWWKKEIHKGHWNRVNCGSTESLKGKKKNIWLVQPQNIETILIFLRFDCALHRFTTLACAWWSKAAPEHTQASSKLHGRDGVHFRVHLYLFGLFLLSFKRFQWPLLGFSFVNRSVQTSVVRARSQMAQEMAVAVATKTRLCVFFPPRSDCRSRMRISLCTAAPFTASNQSYARSRYVLTTLS